jgi:hypothetical protein
MEAAMIRKIRMGFLKISYSKTYIITIILYLAAGQYAVSLFLGSGRTGIVDLAYSLALPYFIVSAAAAVFTAYFTHLEFRDRTMIDFASVAQDRGEFASMKFWTLAAASLLMSVFEAALMVIEAMLRTTVTFTLKDIGYAALIFCGFYIMYLMLYAVFELISILLKSETMSAFLGILIAWGIPYGMKLFNNAMDVSMRDYALLSDIRGLGRMASLGIYTGIAAVIIIIAVMISCAVMRRKNIEKACY